uniref:Annexin ANNAT3 n=1 Tax=Kalanchoe fedtschenkoi TaxID=63787 RepID=A0A7N0T397_KALFE
MARSDEHESLAKAFSGFGVDESCLVRVLGKWHPEERKSFRKATPFFLQDDRLFERWDDHYIALLEREFMRLKSAVVLWAMHPWERDARLAKEALIKGGPHSYGVLIEVVCTRSADDWLGARRAYHSLYDHSIEEDVAYNVKGAEAKLLVGLVSSYRYEGPKVNEDVVKSEAALLLKAIRDKEQKAIDDDEIVRILSTRSKPHLKAIYNHLNNQELNTDPSLKDTVHCLCSPETYFSSVLDSALKHGADEASKEALTRVIVTRADVDLKEINEAYVSKYGVSLSEKINEMTSGNFKEFLLTLVARGD